jgi:hypothetical protein
MYVVGRHTNSSPDWLPIQGARRQCKRRPGDVRPQRLCGVCGGLLCYNDARSRSSAWALESCIAILSVLSARHTQRRFTPTKARAPHQQPQLCHSCR